MHSPMNQQVANSVLIQQIEMYQDLRKAPCFSGDCAELCRGAYIALFSPDSLRSVTREALKLRAGRLNL